MQTAQVSYHTITPEDEAPSALYEVIDRADGTRSVHLFPHEGQSRALYSQARHTAMVAGTQSGKTSFGPWWCWARIRGISAPEIGVEIPEVGPGVYIAISPTYDLTKLKLIPEMIEVFCHVLRIGRWWAGDKVLELKSPPIKGTDENGDPIFDYDRWAEGEFTGKRSDDPRAWGRFIIRSAQAKGGLESATAKLAWIDEGGQPSFTQDAWEAILRRLSLARGVTLITTTPYISGGWLKTEIIDPAQDGDPSVRLITVPSIINPQFPREEYEDRRRKMTPERFAMMYEGKLVKLAGLVWPDYEPVKMLIDRKRYRLRWNEGWHFVGGVDFGWHNPFAMVLLARSPDGVVYVLREYSSSETLLADHAAEMRAWETWLGEHIVDDPSQARPYRIAWYGDPSARAQIEELYAMGILIEKANNDVIAGIDAVTELLRTGRFWLYGPKPKLTGEVEEYTWEMREDQLLDKPRKVNDHLCDAMRYGCIALTTFVSPAGAGGHHGGQKGGARSTADVRKRARQIAGGGRSTNDIKNRALGRSTRR